jgi:trigger factor
MKKKILFIVISLCITMLAWGCEKKNVASELDAAADSAANTGNDIADGSEEGSETTDTAAVNVPEKDEYKASDYITLGEYKGLTVTYTKLEVTDADVEETIKEGLAASATQEEVTGRPVQEGDTVNIDYEGLKDGVAFDGGTAQGQELMIGSGRFIDGFEEGLIGANIGDKITLNLTFPENYPNADLAGQAVVFNVTVNSIKADVIPELTEEYVKNNTDYDTIEAYKEATRANLVEANEKTMKNEKIANLIEQIVKNSTISSYPQTLIDYYAFEMENYYTQYAQMLGFEFSDFLEANKMTQEEFDVQKNGYAESRAAQELALQAVIEAEGIELSEEEYKDGVTRYTAEGGYPSEEEFLKLVPEKEIREVLLWEKAVNFLMDNSVIS